VLDRVIRVGRARRFGRPTKAAQSPEDERVMALERRIMHLEAMIEGLQDAVHREGVRTNRQLDDLRKRTEAERGI
jgi:uncharacterized coiled-coil protein SlyX